MRKRFVYVICNSNAFDGSPIAIFRKRSDAESSFLKIERLFRKLYIERRRLW